MRFRLPITASPVEGIASPLVICGKAEYSACRMPDNLALDVVTVTHIDRFALSTFDLFAIVRQMVDAKAQFRSLVEPWADTGTSTGRLMIAVLGGIGGRGTRSYPHPHRRGPQPGAEARAADGPSAEIDGGAAGRVPLTPGGECYACRTRPQLRRGKEHDLAAVTTKPRERPAPTMQVMHRLPKY